MVKSHLDTELSISDAAEYGAQLNRLLAILQEQDTPDAKGI